MSVSLTGVIVGPTGPTGPQGIQGEQGVQGIQGEIGLTPTLEIHIPHVLDKRYMIVGYNELLKF